MNFMWTFPLYSADNFQKTNNFRQNCQFFIICRRNTTASTETSRIFLETTIKLITGTLIYKSNNNSYHDGTRAFFLSFRKRPAPQCLWAWETSPECSMIPWFIVLVWTFLFLLYFKANDIINSLWIFMFYSMIVKFKITQRQHCLIC